MQQDILQSVELRISSSSGLEIIARTEVIALPTRCLTSPVFRKVAEPYEDFLCMLIHGHHQRNLVVSFPNVGLIDADGVDPERPGL
jgi:hypothetical protein